MPNMSWILGRSGVPVYKADWTDSNSVENAIIYNCIRSDQETTALTGTIADHEHQIVFFPSLFVGLDFHQGCFVVNGDGLQYGG